VLDVVLAHLKIVASASGPPVRIELLPRPGEVTTAASGKTDLLTLVVRVRIGW
jgi:hypothetical protein